MPQDSFLETTLRNGEKCSICRKVYGLEGRIPILLTCNHYFCLDCITKWSAERRTCPLDGYLLYWVPGHDIRAIWHRFSMATTQQHVVFVQTLWAFSFCADQLRPDGFDITQPSLVVDASLKTHLKVLIWQVLRITSEHIVDPDVTTMLFQHFEHDEVTYVPLLRLFKIMMDVLQAGSRLLPDHMDFNTACLWWKANACLPDNIIFKWDTIERSLKMSTEDEKVIMRWFTVVLAENVLNHPNLWSGDLTSSNRARVVEWGLRFLGFEYSESLVQQVASVAQRLKYQDEANSTNATTFVSQLSARRLVDLWSPDLSREPDRQKRKRNRDHDYRHSVIKGVKSWFSHIF
ncbi:hypothetical protein P153DRAFT_435957 [Dothidotthia symphoricarpi CBS 119687]|uniref:RING-type domain-containing protein n=1 Tax=Dothidotthia symphoricarpi CBS 119687 TaxID=1392245 RepID=A0A6A5ZUV1_9PLEO|nr:uncharacterized protein P153DRAFT_435957 [Dothidotthia symphoricarpi CBS 119687]KAF2123502.1 hypothetical protein P153DRAFT_435957 [Dothidotthia symphoricarpi CBS 119687]